MNSFILFEILLIDWNRLFRRIAKNLAIYIFLRIIVTVYTIISVKKESLLSASFELFIHFPSGGYVARLAASFDG